MANNNTPLTLIHFGDLHVWSLGIDRDPAFKRLLGLANLMLRRGRKFPASLAQMLVERIERQEADYLLFTGDLTTTALRREFAMGLQLMRPLIERWEGRFVAIPGNHDRYTHRATRAQFFEQHFLKMPETCPFAMDLDERWTLVAFDCAVPRRISSRGSVPPAMLAMLEKQLRKQKERGRQVIAAGHYPLVYPDYHKPGWEHILPERAAVLNVLRDHDVRAYMHGHVHHRWRLDHGGLSHLNCGSAGMNGSTPSRRPGYLKITLGEHGLEKVEAHWLQRIPHQMRRAEDADWTVEELAPDTIQA